MLGAKSSTIFRVVADVWEKDVWVIQAKSGSSASCRLFLRFLGKIAVQKMLGKRLEVPDILLPDIHGLLNIHVQLTTTTIANKMWAA